MASKRIRTDVNYAWPSAEIAVMGPEGAVDIVYKRDLDQAENREEMRQKKIEEFRDRLANLAGFDVSQDEAFNTLAQELLAEHGVALHTGLNRFFETAG
jgi:acetyl-CoA carboxylase carboxyltransferase component